MTRKPFGEQTWFTLAAALMLGAGCGGTSASSPTPSEPRTSSALSSSAYFDKTSDWGTGFCGDLHVPNATGQTINGWTVRFVLAQNVRLTSVWNGQWTVEDMTGATNSVRDASWNAQVAPGAEVTFGMCGNYSGTFIAPFNCTLNGTSCGGDTAPIPPPPAGDPQPPPPATTPQPPPPSSPPSGSAKTEYAPYFYTWGWGNSSDYSFRSLMDLHTQSGLNAVTLAFVLGNSSGGNPCSPTNDGTTNLIETQMVSDIQAFQAAGGHIKVSFGGANGLNLDSPQACTNADFLSNALIGFVERTGLTDLDFDVEQNEVLTPQVNAKRSEALWLLQRAHPEVKVSFTLAAVPRDQWNTPGGLLPSGVEVVRSALQFGVVLSHVNLMTMDFGSYYSSGHNMGDLANSALRDAHDQLESLLPGLTDAQTWGMLGATPMIGHNDISSETFSTQDARILVEFVNTMGVGLVSFWAIQRDQPCPHAGLDVCSGVNTRAFEFHDILKTVHP